MKKITQFKKLLPAAGIFLLITTFTRCSDDDNVINSELPTGSINISNVQTLTGNILTVPSVTVGQDSWLIAVLADEEITGNIISQPVFIEKGITSNVQLIIDESVVNYNKHSATVELKLYAENEIDGILGEWDVSDKLIISSYSIPVKRTITIFADLTNYNPFTHSFDLDGDGTLDLQEVSNTYPNNFNGVWDIDMNGHLDSVEFYNTTFLNSDSNWDNWISPAEWNEGYLRMFGNWAENDFSAFDITKDRRLDRNEWYKIFKDSQFFESYDADSNNVVTQLELNQGFFEEWDSNDDSGVDEDEFNAYRPYVINWTYGYWDY